MQYETPSAHLPCTQVFEQHWAAVASVQELPDVAQLGLRAAHAPLLHLPPQHSLSALHLAPSETHAAAAHCLFSQRRLQQSVAAAHASLLAAQLVNTDAQALVFGSHTPEQQSLPPRQASLKALQLLPAPVEPAAALRPALLVLPSPPLPVAAVPPALSPASALLPPSPVSPPSWLAEFAPLPAAAPLSRPALLPLALFPADPAVSAGPEGRELEPQATPNPIAASNTAPRARTFDVGIGIFLRVGGPPTKIL